MESSEVRARPARLRLLLAFGAVYFVWGSTYLAIRYAIDTLPIFLMAGARHVTAGTILFALARLRGDPFPDLRSWKSSLLIGSLLLLGGNGAVVWAEQRVPTGLTALLVATEPLWVMVLVWLRPGGVRMSGQVAAGLVCGFSGMIFLVNPFRGAPGTHVDLWGAVALISAAFSWAVGSIYAGRVRIAASPLMGAGMQMLTGGTLLILAGSAAGEWWDFSLEAVSARSAMALAYLIVFGSLIGFTSYSWLLGVAAPSTVSTYAYVNPVIAVVLGWVFRGEPITPRVLLAAFVIILGVVIIITYQGRQQRRP